MRSAPSLSRPTDSRTVLKFERGSKMLKSKHHKQSAKLAAAIYGNSEKEVRENVRTAGFTSIDPLIITGDSPLSETAMFCPAEDVTYLVFKGTVNKQQWLSNLNLLKRTVQIGLYRGKVHRGFWKGLSTIIESVLLWMQGWMGQRDIVIAAHSRGAGFGIITALILNTLGYTVREIHLFGCPRTLNPVLAAIFDAWYPNTWNWVANNDAVHRVPFKWMQYRHVGTRMYFDSSDKLHEDPEFRIKLKGQLFGRIKGGLFDGVRDHNAVKEYERLVSVVE